MSTTTTPGTFSELYGDLANRVREQTGVTATQTLMKRYVDLANQDLYIGTSEKLPWAKRRATITTHPQYTTGTISVTVGSTSVTGTGTAWTTNNDYGQPNARAGGKMVIAGRDEVYGVSAVGGATSMTLATAYIGPTDTEATYVYFEDEYALASAFARPYDVLSFDDNRDIELVGDLEFRRHFPRNRIPTTRLRAATIVDHPFSGSTAPVRKVRFGPPPSNAQLIEYSYITKNVVVDSSGTEKVSFTADTDEPIVPLRYRNLITLHALYHWYRDQKDDVRSGQVRQEYFALLGRVVEDQEVGAQRASMRPNTGASYRARRPYSRRGARPLRTQAAGLIGSRTSDAERREGIPAHLRRGSVHRAGGSGRGVERSGRADLNALPAARGEHRVPAQRRGQEDQGTGEVERHAARERRADPRDVRVRAPGHGRQPDAQEGLLRRHEGEEGRQRRLVLRHLHGADQRLGALLHGVRGRAHHVHGRERGADQVGPDDGHDARRLAPKLRIQRGSRESAVGGGRLRQPVPALLLVAAQRRGVGRHGEQRLDRHRSGRRRRDYGPGGLPRPADRLQGAELRQHPRDQRPHPGRLRTRQDRPRRRRGLAQPDLPLRERHRVRVPGRDDPHAGGVRALRRLRAGRTLPRHHAADRGADQLRRAQARVGGERPGARRDRLHPAVGLLDGAEHHAGHGLPLRPAAVRAVDGRRGVVRGADERPVAERPAHPLLRGERRPSAQEPAGVPLDRREHGDLGVRAYALLLLRIGAPAEDASGARAGHLAEGLLRSVDQLPAGVGGQPGRRHPGRRRRARDADENEFTLDTSTLGGDQYRTRWISVVESGQFREVSYEISNTNLNEDIEVHAIHAVIETSENVSYENDAA